jgi:tRNA pseudouridine38-40 synthase
MRVKAVIAYDGSHYFGFQKQTSTKQTIMYALEEALSSLHIHSNITGSGRTDAGVHASGQVIHFDLPEYWSDLQKLKCNLNRKLDDIHIKHITHVPDDFHARFWAKKRVYRYVFKTKDVSVFEKRYISQYRAFDAHLLQEALHCFEGKHDFDYFRKTGTQTHTSIREIYATYYKEKQGYHFIYFEANGFLRSQVRMMVDAAMQCATETLSIEALKAQISCSVKHSTKLAPPEGLYLARIIY